MTLLRVFYNYKINGKYVLSPYFQKVNLRHDLKISSIIYVALQKQSEHNLGETWSARSCVS